MSTKLELDSKSAFFSYRVFVYFVFIVLCVLFAESFENFNGKYTDVAFCCCFSKFCPVAKCWVKSGGLEVLLPQSPNCPPQAMDFCVV